MKTKKQGEVPIAIHYLCHQVLKEIRLAGSPNAEGFYHISLHTTIEANEVADIEAVLKAGVIL